MTRSLLFLCATALAWAQGGSAPFSHHVLQVKQYSQAENEAIVKKFHGMRVTDVMDGLDVVGLQDLMVMDPAIRPKWRDERTFTHRIYGAAVTLRIVPTQERAPVFANKDDYYKWKRDWAGRLSRGGYPQYLTPDTVLVIDASQTREMGICGSANAYGWLQRGMRGIVTDGGCRDSDEMILERIPVYERNLVRGINEGRMVIESWNAPVNVGGVTVMPGDIVVADADGVVVVPRAKAEAVAAAAREVLDGDKASRRKLYEKAGRPADFTVK